MDSKAKYTFLLMLFFFLTPAPSPAKITIVGGLTHERAVQAGQSYDGSILLHNPGVEPQEVKIYQTDYLFFFDGTSDVLIDIVVERMERMS